MPNVPDIPLDPLQCCSIKTVEDCIMCSRGAALREKIQPITAVSLWPRCEKQALRKEYSQKYTTAQDALNISCLLEKEEHFLIRFHWPLLPCFTMCFEIKRNSNFVPFIEVFLINSKKSKYTVQ